jgi:uncharacterized protein YbjT (DUF2867 family)
MLGDMTTAARRVCVTGATGKAGRAAVQELREHRARDLLGYEPAHFWRDYVK